MNQLPEIGNPQHHDDLDLLIGCKVHASSEHADHPASCAVDGREGTHWKLAEPQSEFWIVIDLGEPVWYNQFGMLTYGYPSYDRYELQAGGDGIQWRSLYSRQGVAAYETAVFEAVQTRFIRIHVFLKRLASEVGMRELSLYFRSDAKAVHLKQLAIKPSGWKMLYPYELQEEIELDRETQEVEIKAVPAVDGQTIRIHGHVTNCHRIVFQEKAIRHSVPIEVISPNGRRTGHMSLDLIRRLNPDLCPASIRIDGVERQLSDFGTKDRFEWILPAGTKSCRLQVEKRFEQQMISINGEETQELRFSFVGPTHRVSVDVTVSAAGEGSHTFHLDFWLPPPEQLNYRLIYEDHFNGNALRESHWAYRTGERYGGYNLPKNVRVEPDEEEQSNLHIDYKYEDFRGDGKKEYTGGGIISRQRFGYGYYEVRAKLYGGGKGVHQSFWSMGTTIRDESGHVDEQAAVLEIDGFEVDSINPNSLSMNAHYYIPAWRGLGPNSIPLKTDEWFVLGYEWLPDIIHFYVGGQHVLSKPFGQYYCPQNVWLTSLPTPGHYGGAEPPSPGARTQFDYFRFYAKPLPGINVIGNPSFDYNAGTRNPQHPIGWVEEGDVDASYVTDLDSRTGEYALEHYSETNYRVITKQRLTTILNGIYRFQAWVKSSGGQKETLLKIESLGGQTSCVSVPAADDWILVEMAAVAVVSNEVAVSICSEAAGGQWIRVDDVSLTWQKDQ